MIKFSKLNIKGKDLKLVSEVIRSGWLSHGQYTSKLEKKFSNYTGSKYAIAVSSCTAALHISCLAANLKKGDEVLVPCQSHTATSHAVEYTGAKPIFVDTDKYTGNINPQILKKKITRNTKALIVVHMNGKACDMNAILKICKTYNLKLIEDCAHSLGSYYMSKRHLGNYGLSGCFSFYPTKQITSGEGGMIITNNKKFYSIAKKLRAFGIDSDPSKRKLAGHYDVKYLGFNYRLTEFQACLAYQQLSRYQKNLRIRRKNAQLYVDKLKNLENIFIDSFDENNSYFLCQIILKTKKIRNGLLDILKQKKIGHSIHYAKPLPSLYYYKKKYNIPKANYKNSKFYSDRVLSLPVYNLLKENEIKKICLIVKNYCEKLS